MRVERCFTCNGFGEVPWTSKALVLYRDAPQFWPYRCHRYLMERMGRYREAVKWHLREIWEYETSMMPAEYPRIFSHE